MNTNNLRIKHPAAYCLWCCLKQTDDDSAPITAQELGWTEAKFRAALERLQALGLVRVETIRQRRRITALEAVGTATEKLRAVEARETERWRPVRVENAQLIMSDGKGWDLPLEMRGAEFEEYWTSFATLTDLKLEQVGERFTPAQFFRNMLEIVEAGKKTNSYNVPYVYNAYAEYIKASKYNIVIANKVADKTETKAPEKAPEKPVEVDRKAREKHVAGIIEAGYMEAGFSSDEAKALLRGNWDKYEQRLARVPGDFPSDAEIEAAALACANGKIKSECTPPKLANRIGNARNPNLFKKTAEKPSESLGESIRKKFQRECSENPHFSAELADLCRLTNPNFNGLNQIEQSDAIFQLFKASQLAEAGV